ncbi:MAG: ADP-ribosylglycohydrolase family protein [Planctomycetes bacterium]|nr:ADP-ribosylglycohydrolase family protein [Planctomycetota bacterium]
MHSASQRMRRSLEALATGDAFGEFGAASPGHRTLRNGPWPWTDDTAMALGIVEVLTRQGRIDQDDLANVFARNYVNDPGRGYGPGQHKLLQQVSNGRYWRDAGAALFAGGSFGNGGAMRVAPLGAYFADDLGKVVEQAALATAVTHAHREGIAGGIAVAVAAAVAVGLEGKHPGPAELLERVIAHTPKGEVRAGLEKALGVGPENSAQTAATALGNGSRITAQDTVPLCVWLAAKHLGSYEEALWQTAQAGGDRDTNCAIVGGILGARGDAIIPPEWLARREPLPA